MCICIYIYIYICICIHIYIYIYIYINHDKHLLAALGAVAEYEVLAACPEFGDVCFVVFVFIFFLFCSDPPAFFQPAQRL